jgi:hypothetical protein
VIYFRKPCAVADDFAAVIGEWQRAIEGGPISSIECGGDNGVSGFPQLDNRCEQIGGSIALCRSPIEVGQAGVFIPWGQN